MSASNVPPLTTSKMVSVSLVRTTVSSAQVHWSASVASRDSMSTRVVFVESVLWITAMPVTMMVHVLSAEVLTTSVLLQEEVACVVRVVAKAAGTRLFVRSASSTIPSTVEVIAR